MIQQPRIFFEAALLEIHESDTEDNCLTISSQIEFGTIFSGENMGDKEQRFVTRVEPDPLEPVEVQIIGDRFVDILNARDVGKAGLGVHIPENYASATADTEVDLIISIPNYKSFNATGIIKHTGRDELCEIGKRCLGIVFSKIRSSDQAMLEEFINKRKADNRRFIRVQPSNDAPVYAHAFTQQDKEEVNVSDISLGGIKVTQCLLFKKCRPDDDIDFLIALPVGEKIQVKGKLRHISRETDDFGICFQHLTSTQEEIIAQYIAQRVQEIRRKIDSID